MHSGGQAFIAASSRKWHST